MPRKKKEDEPVLTHVEPGDDRSLFAGALFHSWEKETPTKPPIPQKRVLVEEDDLLRSFAGSGIFRDLGD